MIFWLTPTLLLKALKSVHRLQSRPIKMRAPIHFQLEAQKGVPKLRLDPQLLIIGCPLVKRYCWDGIMRHFYVTDFWNSLTSSSRHKKAPG